MLLSTVSRSSTGAGEHPLLEPLQIAGHQIALMRGLGDAVTFVRVGHILNGDVQID